MYQIRFTVREPEQATRHLTARGKGPFAAVIARRLRREYDAEITVYGSAPEYTAKWFDNANQRYRESQIVLVERI